ncbi:hypothetical protein OG883_40990 [Streptomyces sp. NBC_01142]|uniref:hypothetical protein n=1 Tax=Streptomyces sp. NBC_01142 TaxID=2975865 RepID=UPI00225B110F|nr:hypothetical protein [Streptomyces sp. NBC_01142]MCX4826050.1 hypothetical protein [Streptomyces sp. NBC_01142]
MPVGADALLVADVSGRGNLMLPVGAMDCERTPEEAAQHVFVGAPDGIPVLRRVLRDSVQMRSRKVITHLVATAPLTQEAVAPLTYRDPRATLHALPTARVIAELPERARRRALLGLQALAIGQTAYLEDGVLQRSRPVSLLAG